MFRVLMSRLAQKGFLGFTIGENNAGSRTSAVAARLQGITLTDEQIKELKEILEKSK